ncbi:MAG: hypothetical protein IPP99_15155 [Chitinophagaceae bacterium]|nr:hypothetical protein [Chitinophagaceae bacterium]
MKKIFRATLIISLFTACSTPKKAVLTQKDLPRVIDSLYQADQATAKIRPVDSAAAAFQRVIRSNFSSVEEIFRKFGFPGYDLVGAQYSDKYFTLVQHSDFNVSFQLEVLKDMQQKVEAQNATGQNFAYLTDRTELNQGRPQIYGTQVLMSANTKLKPCIDSINLDKRRLSVGLGPIQEYIDQCNAVFFQLNPQEKNKPGGN